MRLEHRVYRVEVQLWVAPIKGPQRQYLGLEAPYIGTNVPYHAAVVVGTGPLQSVASKNGGQKWEVSDVSLPLSRGYPS